MVANFNLSRRLPLECCVPSLTSFESITGPRKHVNSCMMLKYFLSHFGLTRGTYLNWLFGSMNFSYSELSLWFERVSFVSPSAKHLCQKDGISWHNRWLLVTMMSDEDSSDESHVGDEYRSICEPLQRKWHWIGSASYEPSLKKEGMAVLHLNGIEQDVLKKQNSYKRHRNK